MQTPERSRSAERTLLLIGRSGQIGHELRRTLATLGRVVAPDVDRLDLLDAEQVRATVRDLAPDAVVNAAAYTAVDLAETHADEARALNAEAPAVLADACARAGALLVHYSTDYVFDGNRDVPYVETDATDPCSVYGETKLAGERAILERDVRAWIFRTSWVYGNRGRNFLRTVLRLASEGKPLRIVDDQYGAPTWARSIAEATAQAIAIGLTEGDVESGVYHMTCSGVTTWCGFARAVVDRAGLAVDVEAIATEAYPTPARRPKYSVLANDRLERAFGIALPPWQTALEACLEDARDAGVSDRPRRESAEG